MWKTPSLALAAALLLSSTAAGFDLQGHRGARGLAPENTLAAFATALSIGVSTLELDVGVSADGVVVVSHDSHLNPELTRGPDGAWLGEPGPPLHALTAEALAVYDVGRAKPGGRHAERFPEQVPADGQRLPRLAEVFALVAKAGNREVRFNIETKLSPETPDETLPPEAFAKALLDVVRAAGMAERVTVQSFDWRTLAEVNRLAPEIDTVCLTAQQRWLDNVQAGQPGASPWTAGHDIDEAESLAHLVRAAGCKVWSPYWKELDAAAVATAQGLGLAVVAWTVDSPVDMARLIAMGVDGLITDYPDRLRRVLAEHGMALPRPTPVTP